MLPGVGAGHGQASRAHRARHRAARRVGRRARACRGGATGVARRRACCTTRCATRREDELRRARRRRRRARWHILHGPAAAARLAREGETRADVLEAIRWHTLGSAHWGRTGQGALHGRLPRAGPPVLARRPRVPRRARARPTSTACSARSCARASSGRCAKGRCCSRRPPTCGTPCDDDARAVARRRGRGVAVAGIGVARS